VHHGGAGTTGQALASGVPQLIIPLLRWADQLQWGTLVQEQGIGRVIVESDPSKVAIERAVDAMLDGGLTHTKMGTRAAEIGAAVRTERSTEAALLALTSCLCNLVLPPVEADAIHPYAGPLPSSLTPKQFMCLRNCVPCRRLREEMTLGHGKLHTAGVS
jgi:hypothetical protein